MTESKHIVLAVITLAGALYHFISAIPFFSWSITALVPYIEEKKKDVVWTIVASLLILASFATTLMTLVTGVVGLIWFIMWCVNSMKTRITHIHIICASVTCLANLGILALSVIIGIISAINMNTFYWYVIGSLLNLIFLSVILIMFLINKKYNTEQQ